MLRKSGAIIVGFFIFWNEAYGAITTCDLLVERVQSCEIVTVDLYSFILADDDGTQVLRSASIPVEKGEAVIACCVAAELATGSHATLVIPQRHLGPTTIQDETFSCGVPVPTSMAALLSGEGPDLLVFESEFLETSSVPLVEVRVVPNGIAACEGGHTSPWRGELDQDTPVAGKVEVLRLRLFESNK